MSTAGLRVEPFRGDFVPRTASGISGQEIVHARGQDCNGDVSWKASFVRSLRNWPRATVVTSLSVSKTIRRQMENRWPREDVRCASRSPACRTLGRLARPSFTAVISLRSGWRQHPGVQLWARERLGIPLRGWKSFGRWTRTPPGDNDSLICGSGVSVVLPGQGARRNLKSRTEYRASASLSGLPTRRCESSASLASARPASSRHCLRTQRRYTNPLDRNLAVYADLGEEPDPSARVMLERLRAQGHPGIVVLDNCPPDSHNIPCGARRRHCRTSG